MADWHLPGTTADYEEDHLISLELGGHPRSAANLWPEAYNPTPGARQKDRVENYLHDEVCAGHLKLRKAQDMIRTDWFAVYTSIGAPGAPGDKDEAPPTNEPAGPLTMTRATVRWSLLPAATR